MIPYIASGTLIIPFNCDPKYRWWDDGQSIVETLKELGYESLVPEYKTNLKGIMLNNET